MMIDRRAISRYARALFLLAEKEHHLEAADRDFAVIKKLVDQHPEISHLLLNSTISHAEKDDFIEKIVPQGISRLVVNLLKVLIEKRRFRELAFIQKEFHKLAEKKAGIQEVEAVTAAELSGKNAARLESILKKKLKCEIRLITRIEPEIMGGFILRFDGKEINASFKNSLDELKQKLLIR